MKMSAEGWDNWLHNPEASADRVLQPLLRHGRVMDWPLSRDLLGRINHIGDDVRRGEHPDTATVADLRADIITSLHEARVTADALDAERRSRMLTPGAAEEIIAATLAGEDASKRWPLPNYLIRHLWELGRIEHPTQAQVDEARIPLGNHIRQLRDQVQGTENAPY